MDARFGRVFEFMRHVGQGHTPIGLALAIDVDEDQVAPLGFAQHVDQAIDLGVQAIVFGAVMQDLLPPVAAVDLGPRDCVNRIDRLRQRPPERARHEERDPEREHARHNFQGNRPPTGEGIRPRQDLARHPAQDGENDWQQRDDDQSFRYRQTLHALSLPGRAQERCRGACIRGLPVGYTKG